MAALPQGDTRAATSAVAPHRPVPAVKSDRKPTYPNPIIANLRLDKTEVCRGEENFLHVDVDTNDNSDADLRIWLISRTSVGGHPTGRRMPIRMFGPIDWRSPPMVVIMGRRATHVERPLPYVKVKDCDAAPFLDLTITRLDGQGPDTFKVHASVNGKPMSQVTWSFGDGTTTIGDGAAVHSYGNRAKRSAYSEFVIAGTATDEHGRVLRGYRTLELVNREYWSHQRGS